MQHWSKIIPIGAWPQGHLLHCACSLVDPNVLSSSRFHHLHQESADKSHTWLPCPPPDLSVAEEEVVGLDPKLLVLWGEGRAGGPCMNAWMLNVATLTWKKVRILLLKCVAIPICMCFYLGSITMESWSQKYLLCSRCVLPSSSPSCGASGRRLWIY